MTTEWCRCGDMSLCHWVSMFNILMSMSVLGCGGVYSAADCWQQTRLGWAGHHRGAPRLGGGRADGQKAGPLDQPLSGPWQLWPGPRMWARGRYYLDKNPRTFPWCCLYLNAWHFQSKLVSYLVSSAGEDDTFPTSFQPAREAKASKMVWCLSGIEKLNALTHGLLFELLGEIKEEDHTRANLHYPH